MLHVVDGKLNIHTHSSDCMYSGDVGSHDKLFSQTNLCYTAKRCRGSSKPGRSTGRRGKHKEKEDGKNMRSTSDKEHVQQEEKEMSGRSKRRKKTVH